MLKIEKKTCGFCAGCVALCEPLAIQVLEDDITLDEEKCTGCEKCVIFCPVGALEKVVKLNS